MRSRDHSVHGTRARDTAGPTHQHFKSGGLYPVDVPSYTVTLPEHVHAQFEQLADEEFVNREEAVEEFLRAGIEAYRTGGREETAGTDLSEEFAGDMWDTAEDPGERSETGDRDDYSF